MSFYQHDGAKEFRFQLIGEMSDEVAVELEQAWQTATSIMRGKNLVVDVTGVTSISAKGQRLIKRMECCGARLIARCPGITLDVANALGIDPILPEELPQAKVHAFWGRRLRGFTPSRH